MGVAAFVRTKKRRAARAGRRERLQEAQGRVSLLRGATAQLSNEGAVVGRQRQAAGHPRQAVGHASPHGSPQNAGVASPVVAAESTPNPAPHLTAAGV